MSFNTRPGPAAGLAGTLARGRDSRCIPHWAGSVLGIPGTGGGDPGTHPGCQSPFRTECTFVVLRYGGGVGGSVDGAARCQPGSCPGVSRLGAAVRHWVYPGAGPAQATQLLLMS